MNCSNCAAPLPPKETVCRYCGTTNEIDLRALPHTDKGPGMVSCPVCVVRMEELSIKMSKPLSVERCSKCFGLFFDPAELELVLEEAVKHVHETDYAILSRISEEKALDDLPVRYRKCPHCYVMMNRRAFGVRSGVIVDACKNHGVWLDSGELNRLLKWAKAGGRLHQERRREEKFHEQELEDYRRELEQADIKDILSAFSSMLRSSRS